MGFTEDVVGLVTHHFADAMFDAGVGACEHFAAIRPFVDNAGNVRLRRRMNCASECESWRRNARGLRGRGSARARSRATAQTSVSADPRRSIAPVAEHRIQAKRSACWPHVRVFTPLRSRFMIRVWIEVRLQPGNQEENLFNRIRYPEHIDQVGLLEGRARLQVLKAHLAHHTPTIAG